MTYGNGFQKQIKSKKPKVKVVQTKSNDDPPRNFIWCH